MSLMRLFCCLLPGCRSEAPEPREPREPPASAKAAETPDAEAFGAAAPKRPPAPEPLKTTSEEVGQAAHIRIFVVRSGLQLQVGDGDGPGQVAIVAALLPAIDHQGQD
jgi:hypothetical protein